MEKVPVTARRARSWSRDEHVGPPLCFDKIPMQHNPFWFAAEVSSETTCPICQARSPLRHRCRIPRKPPRFFLISVLRRASSVEQGSVGLSSGSFQTPNPALTMTPSQ